MTFIISKCEQSSKCCFPSCCCRRVGWRFNHERFGLAHGVPEQIQFVSTTGYTQISGDCLVKFLHRSLGSLFVIGTEHPRSQTSGVSEAAVKDRPGPLTCST